MTALMTKSYHINFIQLTALGANLILDHKGGRLFEGGSYYFPNIFSKRGHF